MQFPWLNPLGWIEGTAYQGITADPAGGDQRHGQPGRDGEQPGLTAELQAGGVGCGDEDPITECQIRPRQGVAGLGLKALADNGDRPVAGWIDKTHAPPGGGVAPGHFQVEAEAPEPGRSLLTDAILPKRCVELDRQAAKPRQLHGSHGSAACRFLPKRLGLADRARPRQLCDRQKADPLNVTNHR